MLVLGVFPAACYAYSSYLQCNDHSGNVMGMPVAAGSGASIVFKRGDVVTTSYVAGDILKVSYTLPKYAQVVLQANAGDISGTGYWQSKPCMHAFATYTQVYKQQSENANSDELTWTAPTTGAAT